MTLFEMNAEQERLMSILCDEETGEINEEAYEALNALEIDKAEKVDGWCYYLKQKKAELAAMKEMLKNAQERYRSAENALNRARERFAELMNGEKFKSAFNSVYYTHSEAVELDDGATVTDIDDDYLTYKEPELNRSKIKAELKLGMKIPGVHLVGSESMVIR